MKSSFVRAIALRPIHWTMQDLVVGCYESESNGTASALKWASAVVFLFVAAACGGGSPTSPSSSTPVPTPTPAGFSGIRYDNIQIAHEFIVGSPIPTQNQTSTYCCWPLPVRNPGSYIFDLAKFPLNVMPSGGTTNVMSDSEMVLVGLNVSPATGTVKFQWHKAVNQDTVVYTYTGSPSFDWSYSFIGHFSWEISEPGSYYVVVDTPWGTARLDFLITATTVSELMFLNETVVFAGQDQLTPKTQWKIGQGGGGGGGRVGMRSSMSTR